MTVRSGAPAADSRSVLQRVLANTGLLIGGRAANALLSLAYLALAARALGTSAFGVLVLINAFAQFLGEVVKFQSWQTLLHYGARPLAESRREEFQQVLRFSLALDLIGAIAGVAIGVVGAAAFGGSLGWSRDMAPEAALYALSIAFMVSATPIGLLRLFDRFDVVAAQQALVSLTRLIGCAAGFVLHWPTAAFLAVWAAGTFAGFAYLAAASVRELRRRDMARGFSPRGPLTRGLPGAWRFATATNLSATLDVAFTHVVTLVLGGFLGPSQAALWRVGQQVADALAKPAKLLVPALYPELARLRVEQGEAAMARLALQVGLVGGGVGAALLIITVIAGRPLLSLILGPDFAPAASLMTWQVTTAVLGIFALPLEPMLVSIGRPGAALKVRFVVCAVFLAAIVPVVQGFGAQGAGAALAAATASMGVGMFWMFLRTRPSMTPQRKKSACATAPSSVKPKP